MTIDWDNGRAMRADGGEPTAAELAAAGDLPRRPLLAAMLRGARGRCPACGGGQLFARYLAVVPACGACGEPLHHQRADDAPPYFATFIVGHVVVALVLYAELWLSPPLWLHAAVFIPLTLALALATLPPVKGALVGQQWALHMHGFAAETLRRLRAGGAGTWPAERPGEPRP